MLQLGEQSALAVTQQQGRDMRVQHQRDERLFDFSKPAAAVYKADCCRRGFYFEQLHDVLHDKALELVLYMQARQPRRVAQEKRRVVWE